ncbi:hypothetical protein AVEN_184566-1 [Araneus ventricosus]|uniref:Endonuclease/exonuclease/phosphatase domain-containing protein n=1 Tax=Araneus ventricosus TaxID=182803 RepID=A0A4Y2G9D2_ARAVE|nr:hypothetical protein AVEN_184566-1 [Araneus ventricosus]
MNLHIFILSIIGEVSSIKKLHSGDLLIQTANASQTQALTRKIAFERTPTVGKSCSSAPQTKLKTGSNQTGENITKVADPPLTLWVPKTSVPSQTPPLIIPLHTNLQAVAVRVSISTLVTVCILPYNSSVENNDLKSPLQELAAQFILIGSLNDHSSLWGGGNVNSRGRQIEDLINDHSLCLLNIGNQTYFHFSGTSFHNLYLVLCSPSNVPNFASRTGTDLLENDSFPIFLAQIGATDISLKRPQQYLFCQADWKKFAEKSNITGEMVRHVDLNVVIHTVTETILFAADQSIPKSCQHFPKQRKSWRKKN